MRHLAATGFLLVTLLSACGQKGPLVLPDKTKHKTIPTAPAATPAPGSGQPATAPAPTPTP
jgi:predicted small lipoprotein YifL